VDGAAQPERRLVTALHSLTPVLAVGWGATAAFAASAWARRYVARRLDSPPGHFASAPDASTHRVLASQLASAVTALGRAIRRLAPATARPVSSTRPDDLRADRRAGWAALAGAGLLVVAPALAAVPVAWAVAVPVLAARRERARLDARLHDQVPDVVDLLSLTTAAGLPVGAALVAIGDRPGGPLGAALARAAAHVRRGGSTAGALAVLGDVGPPARPLVDALVQHDRYGTPLLPALERVAIEARARRRRRAEEAARRLPVTLLFPLVLTTFPAFVLLTVVPLLAGSLGSLSLSPT
jgi:Flp pilus assembly protein TadB